MGVPAPGSVHARQKGDNLSILGFYKTVVVKSDIYMWRTQKKKFRKDASALTYFF